MKSRGAVENGVDPTLGASALGIPVLMNGLTASSPAFGADGTLYVGTTTNSLYAIGPLGRIKWVFLTLGPVVSSPAIGPDGTIYFGSDDGTLYAVKDQGTSGRIGRSCPSGRLRPLAPTA